ncbi:MAG: hypothetical protein SFX19_04870 [Alphaproteobacteria bacterium]|nr:hypothetical protein [Alphaproteobacteria bacterium]
MSKRNALILLAVLVPVVLVIIVARFALPPRLQAGAENTTAENTTAIVAQTPRTIPETLEQARAMAIDRLAHLQGLSQSQWEQERKTITHKFPPENIDAAVARTQMRVDDLKVMKPEEWEKERTHLLEQEDKRLKEETQKP